MKVKALQHVIGLRGKSEKLTIKSHLSNPPRAKISCDLALNSATVSHTFARSHYWIQSWFSGSYYRFHDYTSNSTLIQTSEQQGAQWHSRVNGCWKQISNPMVKFDLSYKHPARSRVNLYNICITCDLIVVAIFKLKLLQLIQLLKEITSFVSLDLRFHLVHFLQVFSFVSFWRLT